MLYQMNNTLGEPIMNLDFRPGIGEVIRNEITGKNYRVYELNDILKTCKAIQQQEQPIA